MVAGIDKFREHFAPYENHYAIIGGTACDLLCSEAGLPFRATKDIDMVLCVDRVDAEFGGAFKTFLDKGGYQAREKSSGGKEFYRFHKPANSAFPSMIELFARKPEMVVLPDDATLTRIDVEQDVVSLSAILLNDAYYEALQNATRTIDKITVLNETLLIPFKAHAFLDLSDRLAAGQKIDSKTIKKHRNDVFRLVQLLPKGVTVNLSGPIQADLKRFLDADNADGGIDMKALGLPFTHDEGRNILRSTYGLTVQQQESGPAGPAT
jgi:hypothetical protein